MFGRKKKKGDFVGSDGGNPIGKIGIDDLNTNGQGLGVGSQNELSFSVLHAKSNAAASPVSSSPDTVTHPAWDTSSVEVKKRKKHRSHAATRPVRASSSVEVKARKKHRLHAKFLVTSLIVVAVVAAIVGVGMFAHTAYQRSLSYSAQLEDEMKQVEVEVEGLQELENLMSELLSGTLSGKASADYEARWNEISAHLSEKQTALKTHKSSLEALQEHISATEKEASNQALIAIDAQLNIIDLSTKVADYALNALQIYEDAESFMNYLLEADSLAREASQLMDDPTSDLATQSISTSEQCKQAFSDASYLLESVQSSIEQFLYGISETGKSEQLKALATGSAGAVGAGAVGDGAVGDGAADDAADVADAADDGEDTGAGAADVADAADDGEDTGAGTADVADAADADAGAGASGADLLATLLSPYYEYISLRSQAQDCAIAMDNAYINMDKATIISETENYNALENEAATLISEAPAEPTEIVQAVYKERRASDSGTFSSERARLEVALTAIEDYLGAV